MGARMVVVSGDVHTGGYGVVRFEQSGDPEGCNLGEIVQLTSSGIVAHPHGDTSMASKALNLLSYDWTDKPGMRSVGRELEKTDARQHWGKFLCERNFLRVDPVRSD